MSCRVTRYEDVVQDEVTPLRSSFLLAEFQGQREVKGQGLLQGPPAKSLPSAIARAEALMGLDAKLSRARRTGRGILFIGLPM